MNFKKTRHMYLSSIKNPATESTIVCTYSKLVQMISHYHEHIEAVRIDYVTCSQTTKYL